VRLAVGARPEYTVNLYSIDYRTWSVKTVLRSERIWGLGANEGLVYLGTDAGVRVLDRKTLAVRALEGPAWALVRDLGDRWLVALARGERALFDPATGRLGPERFRCPKEWGDRYHLVLSPDHARIAAVDVLCSSDPKGVTFGQTRVLETQLEVLTLGTGELARTPIRLLCTGGSGRPVIPHSLEVAFSADSTKIVCSSERARDGAKDPAKPEENELEALTLDAKTLAVVAREPAKEKARPATTPAIAVPDWLKKDYDALGTVSDEGGRRLAHAFIRSRGVEHEIPVAVLETMVAFSPDGKRFLLKMWTGASRDTFFLGDLETKELRQLSAPPSLRDASLSIARVKAGG
jgi:hypothetical protein